MLSVSGSQLPTNSIYNREIIGKTYDILAVSLQEKMDNTILKEYIEWWINAYCLNNRSQTVYLNGMLNDGYINKFLSRHVESKSVLPESQVDDATLYKVGGLQSLLLSKGIVAAHSYLIKTNETNISTKISDTLKKCSKKMIVNVVNITMKNKSYSKSALVDFISIAKPALDFFGIKDFNHINYKEFFQ